MKDIHLAHQQSLATEEKVSALVTEDYLAERAQRGSRAKFERAMAKVAEVPPEAYDALPELTPTDNHEAV